MSERSRAKQAQRDRNNSKPVIYMGTEADFNSTASRSVRNQVINQGGNMGYNYMLDPIGTSVEIVPELRKNKDWDNSTKTFLHQMPDNFDDLKKSGAAFIPCAVFFGHGEMGMSPFRAELYMMVCKLENGKFADLPLLKIYSEFDMNAITNDDKWYLEMARHYWNDRGLKQSYDQQKSIFSKKL